MDMVLGILCVLLAGMGTGTMAWPLKAVRTYKFEQLWPLGMFVGLFLIPWVITLSCVPNVFAAYAQVDPIVLIKSNLFAMAWGICNVIYGICIVRIGASLAGAILTSIGLSMGVVIPMVFRASGIFENAPTLGSTAGLVVLAGVATIIVGVVVSTLAGFGRDRILGKQMETSGNFAQGLLMVIVAGILSCGISFSFIYAQGPIVAAMKAQGASNIPANIAVWAVGLLGGTLMNVIFPAYMMTRNKSWSVYKKSGRDFLISVIFGIQFIAAMIFLGRGMLYLGVLGASVGWGIMQGMQILGSIAVGFVAGEWLGVRGKHYNQMLVAILIMIIAIVIIAFGNTLA